MKLSINQRRNIELIIHDLSYKSSSTCVGYKDGSMVCSQAHGNEPCLNICWELFPEGEGSSCPCHIDELSNEEVQRRFESIL